MATVGAAAAHTLCGNYAKLCGIPWYVTHKKNVWWYTNKRNAVYEYEKQSIHTCMWLIRKSMIYRYLSLSLYIYVNPKCRVVQKWKRRSTWVHVVIQKSINKRLVTLLLFRGGAAAPTLCGNYAKLCGIPKRMTSNTNAIHKSLKTQSNAWQYWSTWMRRNTNANIAIQRWTCVVCIKWCVIQL